MEALKLEPTNQKSSTERVKDTHTDEIIFALCGFLGSNFTHVTSILEFIMRNEYGYDCEIIKLSDLIKKHSKQSSKKIKGSAEYKRLKGLIENGNDLRESNGNEVLAELAIRQIGLDRTAKADKKIIGDKEILRFKSRRKCYIIDSIKHKDELIVLKEVYRNLLYTIGIYSPYKTRHDNLKHKGLSNKEIVELIDQDNNEGIANGQEVTKVFSNSDFFLRIDSSSNSLISQKLKRFLHLIFETSVITPTKDETAMYFAASASANSACLSRQVGAAIVDKNGNLLSTGWNDVPCFGGNLYQSKTENADSTDSRCLNFRNGKCINDESKSNISSSLVDELIEKELVKIEDKGKILTAIKDSRFGSLIEFSRSIHAEMHALIIGSQKSGDKMVNGKLFVTTYPCHNCARHIVLAGISEVYFIEPYPKSLATILHSDSITEDENDKSKVRILLYDGVAPSRYIQLFKLGKDRKDTTGSLVKREMKKASPKYTESIEALYTLESTATKNIDLDNFPV